MNICFLPTVQFYVYNTKLNSKYGNGKFSVGIEQNSNRNIIDYVQNFISIDANI